ncbi:MAG: hypothetical protein ABIP39_04165 [Polyangiaceae bacterium]
MTFCIVAIACGKKDEAPAAAYPAGSASAGQQGYPQQGYPQQGYPQQGTAPQQGMPQQQGTVPQQGAPVSGQPGQLATPGPLALPCSNDSGCGLAHCNTQFGKCAFPCVSPSDCIQGASCNTMTGFCLPGGG